MATPHLLEANSMLKYQLQVLSKKVLQLGKFKLEYADAEETIKKLQAENKDLK